MHNITTLEFLRLILPAEGVHFLAVVRDGYDWPQHYPYHDLEDMAAAVQHMSSDPTLTVYHACAAFYAENCVVETNKGPKVRQRVGQNASHCQSFWCDLDVGQDKFDEGKGYLTKKDAMLAMVSFAKTIGWPIPMFVDSGGGIHCYWPLDKPLNTQAWRAASSMLKACMAYQGLRADPTRTADIASVLRPVGSIHRKDKGNPRTVAVRSLCALQNAKALYLLLRTYAHTHDVKLYEVTSGSDRALKDKAFAPTPEDLEGINADLIRPFVLTNEPADIFLPSSGGKVAEHCAQIACLRDTQGDVDYNIWFHGIGLLTHCIDGEQLAEEWTERRAETGHKQINWQTRYETYSTDPPRCQTFEMNNPAGCQGCPHKGKITSPIQLGRIEPDPVELVQGVVTDDGEIVAMAVDALPQGYRWDGHQLMRLLPDKNKVLQQLPFCTTLFYPVLRIRNEKGHYKLQIHMHLPDHRIRKFEMAYEDLASPMDMQRTMAKHELMSSNFKD